MNCTSTSKPSTWLLQPIELFLPQTRFPSGVRRASSVLCLLEELPLDRKFVLTRDEGTLSSPERRLTELLRRSRACSASASGTVATRNTQSGEIFVAIQPLTRSLSCPGSTRSLFLDCLRHWHNKTLRWPLQLEFSGQVPSPLASSDRLQKPSSNLYFYVHKDSVPGRHFDLSKVSHKPHMSLMY